MSVSFDGVGQVCATFLGGGLTDGQVVKMSGGGAVEACKAGDLFCGVAMCCKDDACSVQVGGFVTVGFSGAAPEAGWCALAANGEGGVRTASDGVPYLVADVDAAAETVTIML